MVRLDQFVFVHNRMRKV